MISGKTTPPYNHPNHVKQKLIWRQSLVRIQYSLKQRQFNNQYYMTEKEQ